jgi:hypothetical protein
MEKINYHQLLPRNAFRYWPSGDYVKTGSDKSTVRFIFYKTTFSSYETIQISEFKIFIKENLPSLTLPKFYNDAELLRVLLGCKFNLKKSLEALKASISWRSTNLSESFMSLHPLCENLLNSGSIYFHGRDCRFRPLLILNINKLNFTETSVDSYSYLLCFLLEFAIQKFMMPGQVENWVVITDLCNKGLTALPKSDIQRIIKVLQENFRCRMAVNYVVNSPSSICFLWAVAKRFIEEHTIKKIKIEKRPDPVDLFKHFNKSQVERKYGGNAPDLTQFWPPTFPEGSLEVEGDNIEMFYGECDTYEEYVGEEMSDVSSNMDTISEKVRIELPDPYEFKWQDASVRIVEMQSSEPPEFARSCTDGDFVIIEDFKCDIESDCQKSSYSIDIECGQQEKGEKFTSRNESLKRSRRESLRASLREAKTAEVIPETPSKTSRFCRICSSKTCSVF